MLIMLLLALCGAGHSGAQGLTFCYPADFDDERLDIYAQSFPMPNYLAYIDAVSPWTAPDWVYESTGRLPELDSIEELQIFARKSLAEDGMPGVEFGTSFANLDQVYYCLYRLDEETGETLKLGRTDCVYESTDDLELRWRASDPMHWPAIDGQLASGYEGKTAYLASELLTMRRWLDVKEIPLPEGTYYLEYEIDDVFMRRTVLDRIEIHWDGENMTFPEDFRWEDDAWVNVKELGR